MPGISLILNKNKLPVEHSKIESILTSQNFLDNYIDKTFVKNDNIFIGANTYQHYPVRLIESEKYYIIIEGKIYNKEDKILEDELKELAEKTGMNNFNQHLKDWLTESDGDFLIYIINKNNNDVYIFNDMFGRLPFYYKRENDGTVICSRYLNFIKELSASTEIDKMAVAQFLLFGYLLYKRTMFSQVNQLRPASLLIINNYIKEEKIYEFNFDNRKYSSLDFTQNVKNLSELFSKACKDRFLNGKQNVMTLSRGLDSRLVASCLHKNNIPFSIATIRYKYGAVIKDEKIATQLAEIFKSDFRVINVDPSTGDDVYMLFKFKEGMNSLFTARILSFYRKIKKEFGENINFITGDNGDKIIYTYDKRIRKLKDLDDLAEYLVNEHSIFNIDTIAKITGVSQSEMLNELKILLNTFPETNLKDKYVHFRAVERPHKFAFQGEDRHRHYFWSISPFWSFPFYNYIMNIPEEVKKRHKLFAAFIGSYSKQAVDLPYSNFKSSVTSFKGKLFMLG